MGPPEILSPKVRSPSPVQRWGLRICIVIAFPIPTVSLTEVLSFCSITMLPKKTTNTQIWELAVSPRIVIFAHFPCCLELVTCTRVKGRPHRAGVRDCGPWFNQNSLYLIRFIARFFSIRFHMAEKMWESHDHKVDHRPRSSE